MRKLVLLLLCSGVLMARPPGDQDIIEDKEMEPLLIEQQKRLISVKRNEMTIREFIDYYKAKVAAARTPRESAKAYFMLGQAHYEFDESQKAREAYTTAQKTFPRFPLCRIALAKSAIRAKSLEEAARHAWAALDLDPDYTKAYLILGRLAELEGELVKAYDFYKKAVAIDTTVAALDLLAQASLKLYATTFGREKERYAQEAQRAARSFRLVHAANPYGYILQARVFFILKKNARALATLDEALRAEIPPRAKLFMLTNMMLPHYLDRRNLPGAQKTLTRLLEHKPLLKTEEAEQFQTMLDDIEAKGKLVFAIWPTRQNLEGLKNEGISLDRRRDMLRVLVQQYLLLGKMQEPGLNELLWDVHKTIVRTGAKGPAPLSLEMLRFFKTDYPDPRLIGILANFVYPFGGETKPPEVRVEAVRTITQIMGIGALPTLLYCLQDDDPSVLRAVDRALSKVTGARSPLRDEGIGPLRADQIRPLRIGWLKYAHSEEGAERIVEALEALRPHVGRRRERAATVRVAPLADHILALVLDDDLLYPAWKESYLFLADYIGNPFRPVSMRDKEVTQVERNDIVARIEAWQSDSGTTPAPVAPKDAKGK
jgi:tetratricopeptide (TPR) repeat protein